MIKKRENADIIAGHHTPIDLKLFLPSSYVYGHKEGGMLIFMAFFLTDRNESSVETTTIPDRPKQFFNESQLYLQSRCLDFLWDFGETRQDRKFLLSKDVFPLVVDALLLQPPLLEDTGQTGIARRIVDINESALGPFGA